MVKTIRCGGQLITLAKPVVMGILNITPDSFFADSRAVTSDSIAARTHQLLNEGAAIIDIGAYSTRPGAAEVSASEETRRLCAALSVVRRFFPQAVVSVDTFRAGVVEAVVREFGDVIVNDISGGQLDEQMFATVAKLGLPYVLMHTRGTPQTMQQLTDYDDFMGELTRYFSERINALHSLGVCDVIVDPGFGFAKTTEQNYELLRRMSEFQIFDCPILVGVSRKLMVCRALDVTPDRALNGTTILNTLALERGADILRVHDVREAVEAAKIVGLVSSD